MSFRERLFSFFMEKREKCVNASPSGLRRFPLFQKMEEDTFIEDEVISREEYGGWELVQKNN